MCKFYSAIVMRNGDILHNENLTSHEDLIDLFNIKDNQSNCNKFVRVEFSPNYETDLPDIDKYNLNVDDSVYPDWFEKHRERVTDYLKSFVSKRIISGKLNLLTGGLYVVNNAEIGRIKSAVVVFLQNSTVNAMWENSTVNAMCGNSTVNEMRGNSTVNAMRGNSTVNAMRDNSTVNAMCGNSTVNEMRDNSTVNKMWDNSTVNEMWENSTVKLNNSKNKLPK